MAQFDTPIDAVFEAVAWIKLFGRKFKNLETLGLENDAIRDALEIVSHETTTSLMYLQPESVALMRLVTAYENNEKVDFFKIDGTLDIDESNNDMLAELQKQFDGKKIKNINELKNFLVNDESEGRGFLNQLLGKEISATGNQTEREEMFDVIFNQKEGASERLRNVEKELFEKNANELIEKHKQTTGIKNKQELWQIIKNPKNYINPQFREMLSDRSLAYAIITEAEKFEAYQIIEGYKNSKLYREGRELRIKNFKGERMTLNREAVKDFLKDNVITPEEREIYDGFNKQAEQDFEENEYIPENEELFALDEECRKNEELTEEISENLEAENKEVDKADHDISERDFVYRSSISLIDENNITDMSSNLIKNYMSNKNTQTEKVAMAVFALALLDYNAFNLKDGKMILPHEIRDDLRKIYNENEPSLYDYSLKLERDISIFPGYKEIIDKNGAENVSLSNLRANIALNNDSETSKKFDNLAIQKMCVDYMKDVHEKENHAQEDKNLMNQLSNYLYLKDEGLLSENQLEDMAENVEKALKTINDEVEEIVNDIDNDIKQIELAMSPNKEVTETALGVASNLEAGIYNYQDNMNMLLNEKQQIKDELNIFVQNMNETLGGFLEENIYKELEDNELKSEVLDRINPSETSSPAAPVE